MLPDLFITDSSEALLSGRKPPFRLVVRARHKDGRRLAIRHAVSEPFVVATRRVRASHKVGTHIRTAWHHQQQYTALVLITVLVL